MIISAQIDFPIHFWKNSHIFNKGLTNNKNLHPFNVY